jgi:hypothetical protein
MLSGDFQHHLCGVGRFWNAGAFPLRSRTKRTWLTCQFLMAGLELRAKLRDVMEKYEGCRLHAGRSRLECVTAKFKSKSNH